MFSLHFNLISKLYIQYTFHLSDLVNGVSLKINYFLQPLNSNVRNCRIAKHCHVCCTSWRMAQRAGCSYTGAGCGCFGNWLMWVLVRHDVRVFGKFIDIETLNKLFSDLLFYFKKDSLKEPVSISATCNSWTVNAVTLCYLDLCRDETRSILLLRCLLCWIVCCACVKEESLLWAASLGVFMYLFSCL